MEGMSTNPTRTKLAAWMRAQGSESRLPMRMFWAGFVIRVLYMTLAHTYKFRLLDNHFEFGWEMGRIGRALATGYGFADPFNGHSGPSAWCPPLYPLLIGGVFKVFGVYTLKSAWVILTINSIFSAATAPAVYEIAWRSFGRDERGLSIARWSGWIWALYPAAMQYAVRWVWDMSLTAFLFAWVLVYALRIRGTGNVGSAAASTDNRQPATRNWLIFGLLWGLICLSNGSLLTFLPACGLWMIRDAVHRGQIAAMLRNVALAAVCFLVVVSPWVVRNWYALHAFVPMRSNFGAELYESVKPSNQGFPWGPTLPLAEANPQFQRYERMGEVAYGKQQGELAKASIRSHPGLFVDYFVKRIYFFWISVPHPAGTSNFVEGVRRINFSFVSFTGLFGLALALKRNVPGAWLYFWAFALFPMIYYLITVQARFRHPLEPLLCVLTVYLFQSADRTRVWSWQPQKRVA
jgi:hypothetical protein